MLLLFLPVGKEPPTFSLSRKSFEEDAGPAQTSADEALRLAAAALRRRPGSPPAGSAHRTRQSARPHNAVFLLPPPGIHDKRMA